MIATLVQVIQEVHSLGWIHRDIKPDNIYFDSSDKSRIILSDWSSAGKVGATCAFVGTRIFGDPPDAFGMHTLTPILDLKSLVRTAFCLSKQRLPLIEDEAVAAKQYWERVRKDYVPFAMAMDLADSSDYSAFGGFFRTSWF